MRQSGRRQLALYSLLVFLAALAVRLTYLSMIDLSPHYDVTMEAGADTYRFFVWGLSIYESGDLVGEGVFNQSPLYPYFLALIFKAGDGGNLILPRLAQLVLGSLTAVLVCLLGAWARGNRAGLLAGLAAAAYGHLILYDGAFLREGLQNFTFMLLLLAMLGARSRPGLARGWAVGAAFGLALLAKPTIAVMIPAAILWLADARSVSTGRKVSPVDESSAAPSPRGSWPALSCGLLLGLVLVMSPLWMRNLAAGVPVFSLTDRGTLEFIAGNHPEASTYGWNVTPAILELDRRSEGSMVKAVVLVLDLYRHDPVGLVRRELSKMRQLVDGFEIPKELNLHIESRYVPLFRLPWLNWPVLLGLAVPGMVIAWRERRRYLELYCFVLLYSLGLVAFYVISSFRLALVPALCVFAGAAADEVLRRLGRRNWRGVALLIVPALFLSFAAWPRQPVKVGVNEYHNLVRHHLMLDEPEHAQVWCEEGLAIARDQVDKHGDAESHVRLARMMYLAGKPLDQVEAELNRADREDNPAWLKFLVDELRNAIEQRRRKGDLLVEGFRLGGRN